MNEIKYIVQSKYNTEDKETKKDLRTTSLLMRRDKNLEGLWKSKIAEVQTGDPEQDQNIKERLRKIVAGGNTTQDTKPTTYTAKINQERKKAQEDSKLPANDKKRPPSPPL